MSRFSIHGSIGAVVVFLLWIYISAVIRFTASSSRRRTAACGAAVPTPSPRLQRRGRDPHAHLGSGRNHNRPSDSRASACEDAASSATRESGEYVSRIGHRLAGRARGPAYPYTFDVADLREINAFTLPGGSIWVYRGAIEAARNESQLAAILAHEVAHGLAAMPQAS